MSDQSEIVRLKKIKHRLGAKMVLDDVSYSFAKNKVTAILGRSGSGKTTLLQILNGVIKPDEGEVRIFNEPLDYRHVTELRHRIGYVIQQSGLFPHLTIESNISILGKIKGLTKTSIDSRVNQLAELTQLTRAHLLKYPHELSGGEQQRVGLCRAMFLNPPLLLMDEPFASLDRETKQGIYTHLLKIQINEPRTLLLVTHDWNEAVTLADYFIWLGNGKIKISGDKNELAKIKEDFEIA